MHAGKELSLKVGILVLQPSKEVVRRNFLNAQDISINFALLHTPAPQKSWDHPSTKVSPEHLCYAKSLLMDAVCFAGWGGLVHSASDCRMAQHSPWTVLKHLISEEILNTMSYSSAHTSGAVREHSWPQEMPETREDAGPFPDQQSVRLLLVIVLIALLIWFSGFACFSFPRSDSFNTCTGIQVRSYNLKCKKLVWQDITGTN